MDAMTEFEIHLDLGPDADPHALDRAAIQTRKDLRLLGVESVSAVTASDAEPGAKGDPVTIGVIAVTVLTTVVPKIIEYFNARGTGKEGRRARFKIGADEYEVTGMTDDQQAAIIEIMKRRLTPNAAPGEKTG